MNVASLELSKELYDLSGWKTGSVHTDNPMESTYNEDNIIAYKYDLGYLLRRLPKRTQSIYDTVMLGRATDNNGWSIVYRDLCCIADTPEDVACKLAIELFKQDILNS